MKIKYIMPLLSIVMVIASTVIGCTSETEPAYVTITGDLATIPIAISDVTDLQTALNAKMNITLQTDLIINGKQFDAGSGGSIFTTTGTWAANTFKKVNSDGTPVYVNFQVVSNTPANNDQLLSFQAIGNDSGMNAEVFGDIQINCTDVTDSSENGVFKVYLLDDGVSNEALYLTSDGILYVDDSYDTFDEYDDAELLREGISLGNKEALLEAGILVKKYVTGAYNRYIVNRGEYVWEGEYMVNTQSLLRLIAGGVYQNRDYIEELENRITELEKLLK